MSTCCSTTRPRYAGAPAIQYDESTESTAYMQLVTEEEVGGRNESKLLFSPATSSSTL